MEFEALEERLQALVSEVRTLRQYEPLMDVIRQMGPVRAEQILRKRLDDLAKAKVKRAVEKAQYEAYYRLKRSEEAGS
jgi:hypothetical protein